MRIDFLFAITLTFQFALGSWFPSFSGNKKVETISDYRAGIIVLFDDPSPPAEDVTKLSEYITNTLEAKIIQSYDSLVYGFAVDFEVEKLKNIYGKIAEMNQLNEISLDNPKWLNEQITKLFQSVTDKKLTLLENTEARILESL